ncbi:MAG: hypothetical protein AAGA45_07155, partial [Verrucomicrobiota bacterium]
AAVPQPVDKLSLDEFLPDDSAALPELPSDAFTPFVLESPLQLDGDLSAAGLSPNALEGINADNLEALSLFGITDRGTRVVILLDTSNSMFERQRDGVRHRFDYQVIKDEVANLIAGLSPQTRFNLAIYEGGSLAWRDELVEANRENKALATAWLEALSESPSASISSRKAPGTRLIEGGGTRLDTALKQAFGYEPEVIFVVTDGEINRSGRRINEEEMLELIRELQGELADRARIHVVHYATAVARDVEVSTMRAIAGRNNGRFRRVKAEPL